MELNQLREKIEEIFPKYKKPYFDYRIETIEKLEDVEIRKLNLDNLKNEENSLIGMITETIKGKLLDFNENKDLAPEVTKNEVIELIRNFEKKEKAEQKKLYDKKYNWREYKKEIHIIDGKEKEVPVEIKRSYKNFYLNGKIQREVIIEFWNWYLKENFGDTEPPAAVAPTNDTAEPTKRTERAKTLRTIWFHWYLQHYGNNETPMKEKDTIDEGLETIANDNGFSFPNARNWYYKICRPDFRRAESNIKHLEFVISKLSAYPDALEFANDELKIAKSKSKGKL